MYFLKKLPKPQQSAISTRKKANSLTNQMCVCVYRVEVFCTDPAFIILVKPAKNSIIAVDSAQRLMPKLTSLLCEDQIQLLHAVTLAV